MLPTCEYGKATLSREFEWEGMSIDATVEVSGSVVRDGTEGIGWGRRVEDQNPPELKALTVFVGGEPMPKCVERLMMQHLHDAICERVLALVGDVDVEHAILSHAA